MDSLAQLHLKKQKLELAILEMDIAASEKRLNPPAGWEEPFVRGTAPEVLAVEGVVEFGSGPRRNRLLPDVARELAKRLSEAADTCGS